MTTEATRRAAITTRDVDGYGTMTFADWMRKLKADAAQFAKDVSTCRKYWELGYSPGWYAACMTKEGK